MLNLGYRDAVGVIKMFKYHTVLYLYIQKILLDAKKRSE